MNLFAVLSTSFALGFPMQPAHQSAATHRANPERELRVVTYNVYNTGVRRKERFEIAAKMLETLKPDILLLQENSTGLIRPGDAAEVFRRELGLPYESAWVTEEALLFRNGLTILSKYPLGRHAGLRFSKNLFFEMKGAQYAEVLTPRGAVDVFNVHLAPSVGTKVKKRQFEELETFVRAQGEGRLEDRALIVGGDFNEEDHDSHSDIVQWSEHLGLRSLYQDMPRAAIKPTWAPDERPSCMDSEKGERVDHLFSTRAIEFIQGQIKDSDHELRPSDHCAVLAVARKR